MKKTMNKVALMSAILCVVYVALAMLIPFAHNVVFAVALCTTLILFVLAAVGCKAAIAKEEGWQSRLLGWPIFKVAAMMLIAQIALSFVLMAVSRVVPIWAAAVIEGLMIAATLFMMLGKSVARDVVHQTERVVSDKTQAWKAIRAKANMLAAGNPKLAKLAEEIRFADPTPTNMDEEIVQMLEALSNDADTEKIKKAEKMLMQRKVIAKESKG